MPWLTMHVLQGLNLNVFTPATKKDEGYPVVVVSQNPTKPDNFLS
jgi:hypothetical protein